ncbi:MAG: DUF58 domain-containing protein [Xanthobacteraceae bacterium]|nr:DUF58 domain-containing protein [Xanthobacteraceae bacterium]QYK44455.1 MAG: DUF58 domain-containing protein [Xanthobacteraceae bacterium]
MNEGIGAAGIREDDVAPVRSATQSAQQIVAAMPRLILEARRAAASVFHGTHGRRRAGPGENFWQYRRFNDGEPATRVDWRRSARDDHLYVREREWEASHTVWIWPDLSPSMVFASPLVWETKRDRALVLAFALGELLVRGGERVAIPGMMRPTANRNVIERMAEAIIHHSGDWQSLPPPVTPGPRDEIVLLSDFWNPSAEITASVEYMSKRGCGGHLVQVVDPAEETFPYAGRIDFREPETGANLMVGRAELWARDYLKRVTLHRSAIAAETSRHGWSFAIHRTDRPASELLIALHARMGESRDVLSRKRVTAKLGEWEAA